MNGWQQHLPVVPVDHDGGHSAGGAPFAGEDNHVSFYFDHAVMGVSRANEARDKQFRIGVGWVAAIGSGHRHDMFLLGPTLAS